VKALICGSGGFVGGHLTRHLRDQGYDVRAVDIKPFDAWYQHSVKDQWRLDLRKFKHCLKAVAGCDVVYNLSCDMGGIGYIENHKAACMTSVLINTHLLMAARRVGVQRYFFSSSACVYNSDKQKDANVTPLKETDAYPALPESGYGEEKLFSERMCFYFTEDYGLQTRVARYHNVYGPYGTWKGGREKAPAAIVRKVIEAKLSGSNEIEIWGDGSQTRSFMFIDDCIKGTDLIMNGDYPDPINLGSSELISIFHLAELVMDIAGKQMWITRKLDAPKGVAGRNSDNTLIKKLYGWEPSTNLRDGMEKLYSWIYSEMTK
jgi:GDP-D-mannose 3', 5'-epimerase